MYDVIVVGARVAGASTALLLARRGIRVLVVDRARFPSDTLSTHQVQVPGVARLHRWGLLERLIAAGTPLTRRVRFDQAGTILEGAWPAVDGVDALMSPRRHVLDTLLVEAAREAGAEVRERFTVDGLVSGDGRVTGIRGREGPGATLTEQATIVVGADGRHSLVAREVAARAYHAAAGSSVAYYTYWSGVRLDAGEMVARDRRLLGLWPTNDGLVISYVAAPADEFDAFRADPEGSILGALDGARDLGQRVRAGTRADRVYGTADLTSRFHEAHGPGWALVGDAGVVMDPVTGQGIAHALRDAESLADAISTGLGGPGSLDAALADHQARRDAALLPMYRFTAELASFAPPSVAQTLLLQALARRPAEVDRFLGVLSGGTPIPEYFSPRNLLHLLGMRGMIRAAMGQRREAAA